MPNVMAAQPNICGALCKSSVIPFLVPRHKVWLTAADRVPCSHTASIGECKDLNAKSILQLAKFRGQEPQKCIYGVPVQETAKHPAKFGWPKVSDVAAVTKPRHTRAHQEMR